MYSFTAARNPIQIFYISRCHKHPLRNAFFIDGDSSLSLSQPLSWSREDIHRGCLVERKPMQAVPRSPSPSQGSPACELGVCMPTAVFAFLGFRYVQTDELTASGERLSSGLVPARPGRDPRDDPDLFTQTCIEKHTCTHSIPISAACHFLGETDPLGRGVQGGCLCLTVGWEPTDNVDSNSGPPSPCSYDRAQVFNLSDTLYRSWQWL